MKWQVSQSPAANAAVRLPKEAEAYFHAGREAIKKHTSPKDLHRFRIATKRFRYSLEFFRPIYGRSLDRRLKALRGLQDSLGKVSDSHTLMDMLPGDPALRHELAQSLKKHAKQFRKVWKAFDSSGCLADWKVYLGSVPRETPSAAGAKRARPRVTQTRR